ncbi:MAG TPA: cytochrome c oxidase assembly protein [Mycobacteriales bacterium]|nr:cytochrome c oxidase assembly protein [Mycobacteriales bacterium]
MSPRNGGRIVGLTAGGVAVLALVLVAVFARHVGAAPYLLLSTTDPGRAVQVLTPLLRLLTDLCAAMSLGSLVWAATCTGPGEDGLLSVRGYRAVRGAAGWAVGWALTDVGALLFDTAGVSGVPVRQLLTPHGFHVALTVTESPKAWLVGLGLVLVVAAGSRWALHWRSAVGLALLAALALLPPLVTGHLSSEAGHDLGTDAIILHVVAATTWLGFVLAHSRYGRRSDRGPYLRVTAACWLVVVGSGIVQSLALISAGDLVGTRYGRLVLASAAAAVLLGVVAALVRRRAAGRAVLAVEAALLVAAVGLSAAMTHLAPPRLATHRSSNAELLVGYPLHGSLTVLGLFTQWRIDLLFGPAAILAACGYAGLRRRARTPWPRWRTLCWMAGCALLFLVTCGGAGRYAPAMFSAHLIRHMVLSMPVPLLWALGDPVGLARRAGLGDGRRFAELGRWAPVHELTRPATALVLFSLSPFLLYFTGLWDVAVRFHWAHQGIDAYFLLVGVAFMTAVIGGSEAERSLPSLIRLGMLLVAMPLDTLFSTLLIQWHRVIGNGAAGSNFYQALGLPWVSDLHADQRLAGVIAFGVGGVSLFAALIVVVATWATTDSNHALLLTRPGAIEVSREPAEARSAR